MAATDKLFAGSIPEIYDRFLVPLIFESYALDLAERLAKTDPRNVRRQRSFRTILPVSWPAPRTATMMWNESARN